MSIRRLALSVFIPLLVLGCGPAAEKGAAPGGGTLKIGEYSSLTGATATFGQSTHLGLTLALDEINAAGGIGGARVEVITEDTQGRATEAGTAVSKLVTQDQVIAVIGEVASSNSLAGAPICNEAAVPMITPASTNPMVTTDKPFVFRVCFIDPFQGTVMAKFAVGSLKLTRVAVLRDAKSDYSLGLAEYFVKEFTAQGGTIVGNEAYTQGDVVFTAPLTNLMAQKPEAIFIPGYYTEVGLIARQARELGFTGALLGGDGWDSPKLTEIGGAAIENCYFSNHYATDDPNPVVEGFIASAKAKTGEVPDAMAVLAYDATKVLAAALSNVAASNPTAFASLRTGSTASPAAKRAARTLVRDAIAATKGFPGVSGTITLDANRDATKSAVVLKVANGGYQFVERIEP